MSVRHYAMECIHLYCMYCVHTYIICLCIRSLVYPPNLPMGQEPTVRPSYRCENHVSDHQCNVLRVIGKAVVLKRKAGGGGWKLKGSGRRRKCYGGADFRATGRDGEVRRELKPHRTCSQRDPGSRTPWDSPFFLV